MPKQGPPPDDGPVKDLGRQISQHCSPSPVRPAYKPCELASQQTMSKGMDSTHTAWKVGRRSRAEDAEIPKNGRPNAQRQSATTPLERWSADFYRLFLTSKYESRGRGGPEHERPHQSSADQRMESFPGWNSKKKQASDSKKARLRENQQGFSVFLFFHFGSYWL